MPDTSTPAPSLWLTEELARQFTRVIEAQLSQAPDVTCVPHQLTAAETDGGENALLWWEQQFSVGSGMWMWVGAMRRSSEEIGNRILKSAGVEHGDAESIRSTYLEFVGRAFSGMASALHPATRLKSAWAARRFRFWASSANFSRSPGKSTGSWMSNCP